MIALIIFSRTLKSIEFPSPLTWQEKVARAVHWLFGKGSRDEALDLEDEVRIGLFVAVQHSAEAAAPILSRDFVLSS